MSEEISPKKLKNNFGPNFLKKIEQFPQWLEKSKDLLESFKAYSREKRQVTVDDDGFIVTTGTGVALVPTGVGPAPPLTGVGPIGGPIGGPFVSPCLFPGIGICSFGQAFGLFLLGLVVLPLGLTLLGSLLGLLTAPTTDPETRVIFRDVIQQVEVPTPIGTGCRADDTCAVGDICIGGLVSTDCGGGLNLVCNPATNMCEVDCRVADTCMLNQYCSEPADCAGQTQITCVGNVCVDCSMGTMACMLGDTCSGGLDSTDCAAGLACNPLTNMCVTDCRINDMCDTGDICSDDDDCMVAGDTCIDDFCRPNCAATMNCGIDEPCSGGIDSPDCAAGLFCDISQDPPVCETDCRLAMDCEIGEPCSENADCANDDDPDNPVVCDPGSGLCAACATVGQCPDGAMCGGNDDCAGADLICDGGMCILCRTMGVNGRCPEGAGCMNTNNCVDGLTCVGAPGGMCTA